MSRVITFSRTFPSYHPKAGQPTYFDFRVARLIYDLRLFHDDDMHKYPDFAALIAYGYPPKHHTIRAGHRWKAGDWFSPRVWGNDINPKSGRSGPYHSKQIQFAPEIQIKKVWNIERDDYGIFMIEGKDIHGAELDRLAMNDGLETDDLWNWIKWPMEGQIICWNEDIEY